MFVMVVGIDNVCGDIIVIMDGDLQNDFFDILMMVKMFCEGYDIVVGWCYNWQDKLIICKILFMIVNWLIGKVIGVFIKDNGCFLKVYCVEVMQSLLFYNELYWFILALLFVFGVCVVEVKVKYYVW